MTDSSAWQDMGIGDYQIRCRFSSKKNHVFLVDTVTDQGTRIPYVLKQYSSPQAMQQEIDVLGRLKQCQVPVPAIIATGKTGILLEYIPGRTLLEVFEQAEQVDLLIPSGLQPAVNALCDWFQRFYCCLKAGYGRDMIMEDINLRNFILTEQGIYGLDFENCRQGKKERDLGRLCAYVLTYHPVFTPYKFRLAKLLLTAFAGQLNLSPETIKAEMLQELAAIQARRNLSLPDLSVFNSFTIKMDL